METIVEKTPFLEIRIPRLVVNEVRRNLKAETFKELLDAIAKIDKDLVVPFEIAAKYENVGFKSADALIAAYSEWAGADILVTENRHFLTKALGLPFKIFKAGQAIVHISRL